MNLTISWCAPYGAGTVKLRSFLSTFHRPTTKALYPLGIQAMWYEGKGFISIGCQSGGPKDNGIGKIKVDLWRLLCEHCTSTYCDEVDHYALVLRVGGKFTDYEDEIIWKVRRRKKDRYIGIDIDIPMSVWSSKTTDELKYYISDKIFEAIMMLVKRLQKDKVEVDEDALIKEVNTAIEKFKEVNYANMV